MRHDWTPLVMAALVVFGVMAIWLGTRDTPAELGPIRPAQHDTTSPAP